MMLMALLFITVSVMSRTSLKTAMLKVALRNGYILDVDLFELNAFEYGKAKKLSRAEAKAIKEQQKIEEEERFVMLSAGVIEVNILA